MKKIYLLLTLIGARGSFCAEHQIQTKEIMQKILVWDSDGTVVGPKNPHDHNDHSKIILPGVEVVMGKAHFNCMISGTKTPTSQDYDPETLIPGFKELMEKLPVSVIAFSASKDGIDCYVLAKKSDGTIEIRKAHEDARYEQYRGKFKKPDIGMFVVLRDVAQQEFGYSIDSATGLMIGDTTYDEQGAQNFGIPFLHATIVHLKN